MRYISNFRVHESKLLSKIIFVLVIRQLGKYTQYSSWVILFNVVCIKLTNHKRMAVLLVKKKWCGEPHSLLDASAPTTLLPWIQMIDTFEFDTICICNLKDMNMFLKTWVYKRQDCCLQPVWPDWAIYWTLGNFSKPLGTINLPKITYILRQFL